MIPIANRDPCPLAVTKTFSLNFVESITPPPLQLGIVKSQ